MNEQLNWPKFRCGLMSFRNGRWVDQGGGSKRKRESKAPSWQAQFAFYLSLATAIFSGYQFWNSEHSAKINAAIDISRKISEDEKLVKLAEALNAIVSNDIFVGKPSNPIASLEDLKPEFKLKLAGVLNTTSYVDYIAQLVISGKINESYLSNSTKCLMDGAQEVVKEAKSKLEFRIETSYLDKYIEIYGKPRCNF